MRFIRSFFRSHLLIPLAAVGAIVWFASYTLRDITQSAQRDALGEQTLWLAGEINADLLDDPSRLQALCDRYAKVAGARVSVIDASGRVVCDTLESPATMANHGERPEVKRALSGQIGEETRYSNTADQRLAYLAAPIKHGNEIVGVVRMAVDASAVDATISAWRRRMILAGVVVAAIAAILNWRIARRTSETLAEMRRGAERFAQGDLNYQLPISEDDDIAGLAASLNAMGRQLEERIATIRRQGHEQETILASMVEGVLAVDRDERIISLNKAAARLLGIDVDDAIGRGLQEVVRNADLRRFATDALRAERPIASDVVLRHERERVLQANGAALRDGAGRSIGAVIVLNDVSRLRQLENMRRDFAANVSHELKTPITSIKGFVETLLDGAIHNPDDAERFLRIIARQADRLNAIIEDLLMLSKIEREVEASEIALEVGRIEQVLQSAVHDCQTIAADRNIRVHVECEPRLMARINPPLLEQAVVNLLDNAIKYSEPGREVRLVGRSQRGAAVIEVEDEGCGIEATHLPRLFERFYRVDRARSRKIGGTGLGLAIVKHIVNAHGGHIGVDSRPGKGSKFTISLPEVSAARISETATPAP